MKIETEILDEFKEQNIRIMAGIEVAAYKLRDGNWFKKISRCNMCGKCCMGPRIPFPLVDGKCIHLKKRPGKDNKEWECFLRIRRPFGCCVGIPQNIPECTIKYEEIK